MGHTENISLTDAEALIRAGLIVQGVPKGHANSVAKALVAAEAEGQAGRGFSRLGDYAAQVRSGKINPNAEISSRLTSQTAVLKDTDLGFAYPALDRSISWGASLARSYGTATMSITNSHHAGALSVQVEKLAAQGLIGLMVTNSPPAIADWGASTPMFCTNPIAFAASRHDAPPLVIDLALSQVARGKVMNAKRPDRLFHLTRPSTRMATQRQIQKPRWQDPWLLPKVPRALFLRYWLRFSQPC